MKVRIVGTEEEVTTAAKRLGGLFSVLETSRLYPRRGDSRLVSIYLDADLPPEQEENPLCPLCRSATQFDRRDAEGEIFECLAHGHVFIITDQGGFA